MTVHFAFGVFVVLFREVERIIGSDTGEMFPS